MVRAWNLIRYSLYIHIYLEYQLKFFFGNELKAIFELKINISANILLRQRSSTNFTKTFKQNAYFLKTSTPNNYHYL